jgi:NCS2 family nucleobase:cation symporter-2
MFGMVAASGIKTLGKVQFEGTHNIMVIAISLGAGMITLAVPNFYQQFPSWAQIILNSGITAGSVVAIALNALLNETGRAMPLVHSVGTDDSLRSKGLQR